VRFPLTPALSLREREKITSQDDFDPDGLRFN
jgi:hypothetical protein